MDDTNINPLVNHSGIFPIGRPRNGGLPYIESEYGIRKGKISDDLPQVIRFVDITTVCLHMVTANRLIGCKVPNQLILLLLCGKFPPPFITAVVIVDFDELFGKFTIYLLDDCFIDLVPKDPWEYDGPCEPVEKTKTEHCDSRSPRYPVREGERLCAFSRGKPWHYLGSCQYL